jgi:hypothetical protein
MIKSCFETQCAKFITKAFTYVFFRDYILHSTILQISAFVLQFNVNIFCMLKMSSQKTVASAINMDINLSNELFISSTTVSMKQADNINLVISN